MPITTYAPIHQLRIQPETNKSTSSTGFAHEITNTNNTSLVLAPLLTPETPPCSTQKKIHLDWFRAVLSNDAKTVRSLIKSGSDVNMKDSNGHTALVHALFGNLGRSGLEIAEDILKSKDLNTSKGKPGELHTLLHDFKNMYDKKTSAFKYNKMLILSEELKPFRHEHYTKNNNETGNWFEAVLSNDIEATQSLIENGINVNIKDIHDHTALMHVLFGDFNRPPNFELASALFNAKDLIIPDDDSTQYNFAIHDLKKQPDKKSFLKKHQEIVKNQPWLELSILPHQISRELCPQEELDKWEEVYGEVISPPPLNDTQRKWFEAIQNTDEHAINNINEMISSSTDINMTDYLGRTALWLAAYKGDVDLLFILLSSDKLIINKKTAGEFHKDLFVIRDCLISGKIENEVIRQALEKLTTAPYPSVYRALLKMVNGALPSTSMISRLQYTLIGAFCSSSR
ncbi:MAG: hypothetical protein ACRESJ_22650 [Pseudomonas sp.]|uniref:ankyrin repeat domain-containing protein n=1 Tax=Pseudomonas sp. TaxID=306 RepID=UPI003D6DD468